MVLVNCCVIQASVKKVQFICTDCKRCKYNLLPKGERNDNCQYGKKTRGKNSYVVCTCNEARMEVTKDIASQIEAPNKKRAGKEKVNG